MTGAERTLYIQLAIEYGEVPTGLAARPVVGKPFHFCFEPPPQR